MPFAQANRNGPGDVTLGCPEFPPTGLMKAAAPTNWEPPVCVDQRLLGLLRSSGAMGLPSAAAFTVLTGALLVGAGAALPSAEACWV